MAKQKAYCHVESGRKATVHLPSGGNFGGGSAPFTPPPDTSPGWYMCDYHQYGSVVRVSNLKRIDPAAEAERLTALSRGTRRAQTDKPGIRGFQHSENMATARLQALRLRQRRFAEILRKAAGTLSENARRATTTRKRGSRKPKRTSRKSKRTSRRAR